MNNKLNFSIQNSTEGKTGTIEIDGVIGELFWGDEISSQDIKNELEEIKNSGVDNIVVNINSLGGDTNHAFAIYNMLKEVSVPTKAVFSGFSASSATIIGMACDEREISENGFFLIHQPWNVSASNLNEAKNNVETLEKLTNVIKAAYYEHVDGNVVDQLMESQNGNGIWLNAEEVVEYGFCNAIYKNKKELIMAQVLNDVDKAGLPAPGLPKEAPEAKSFIDKAKEAIFGGKKIDKDELFASLEDMEKRMVEIEAKYTVITTTEEVEVEEAKEEVEAETIETEEATVEVEATEEAETEAVEEEKEEVIVDEVIEEEAVVVEETETEVEVTEEEVVEEEVDELAELRKELSELTAKFTEMSVQNEVKDKKIAELESQPLSTSVQNEAKGDDEISKPLTKLEKKARAYKAMADFNKKNNNK